VDSDFIEGILGINQRYFYKCDKDDDIRFRVIRGYVFCYATERVYESLVGAKDIEPIENLPKIKKEKYWRLANLFCYEERDKIVASRAACILELITSTYDDEMPKVQEA